jgi:Cysteine rich repeat
MKTLLIFVACTVLGFGAFAGEKGAMMGKCHKEMKELCNDKMGKEMWACAKENVTKLSADCQKKLAEKKEMWHEHKEACKEDREKFCKDVKPGGGRIIECMKKNMDQLSEKCKEHVTSEKGEHAE